MSDLVWNPEERFSHDEAHTVPFESLKKKFANLIVKRIHQPNKPGVPFYVGQRQTVQTSLFINNVM